MTAVERFRMKPYIQPFEKVLAMEELTRLAGMRMNEPIPQNGECAVAVGEDAERVAAKLAYWESFGEKEIPTRQVLREASVAIARNGVALSDIAALSEHEVAAKVPRKRSLRYGTHGIHEYRGKFFPQLVKALINISGVGPKATVLDPMCGSGTTIVEAITEGHLGIGFDMNPLSVFVSNVKCRLLTASPSELVGAYEELEAGLASHQALRRFRSERDQAYLDEWFAAKVLGELDVIEGAIDRVRSNVARDLYRVALSNVLRTVSYQKEADLRVRREYKNFATGAALAAFKTQALRSTKSVVAFLAHGHLNGVGTHRVQCADARSFSSTGLAGGEAVDLIITSPPYATALPYLDTDRLSLIYLGLLPRADHRARDTQMIGNREVTERGRKELWSEYEARSASLPASVRHLVDRIHTENSKATVGFRRRNLPALLGRYFMDMRDVLIESHRALKPGGAAYFVVGNNRTTTPEGEIEIETAQLLRDIAELVGFESPSLLDMDMLTSRDLFSKNQTPSEHIIRLRKSEVAESLQ